MLFLFLSYESGSYFFLPIDIYPLPFPVSGISASMTALCWNAISYSSDDVSEVGVKIFQRPATNEEYDLRAKKDPPFCKEEQNKANAW